MEIMALSEFYFRKCETFSELAAAIYEGERYEGYYCQGVTLIPSKENDEMMFLLKSGVPIAFFNPFFEEDRFDLQRTLERVGYASLESLIGQDIFVRYE